VLRNKIGGRSLATSGCCSILSFSLLPKGLGCLSLFSCNTCSGARSLELAGRRALPGGIFVIFNRCRLAWR